MNKNGLLYTIIFSFAVTFILVVPLALANEATKSQVAQNKVVESGKAVLTSLGINIAGLTDSEVLVRFAQLERYLVDSKGLLTSVKADEKLDETTSAQLIYKNTGPELGKWSKAFSGAGLWGTVTLVLGFSEPLDKILGFYVLNQQETPGLGGRIGDKWFAAQFSGQSIVSGKLSLNAIGTGTGDVDFSDSDIDGVSGATRTSESVRDIVNNAITYMKKTIGEAKQ